MAKVRVKTGFETPVTTESSDKNVVGISRESVPVAGTGLEAIQEILFGEQIKSHDKQLSELQRNNEETLLTLSNSVDQRFEELTNNLNQKFEALTEQILDQKNTQQVAEERLNNSVVACKAALTQSIDSMRESMNVQLNQMADEIEDKKLDRGKLAEVFEQVAIELASTTPVATTPSKP